MATINLLSTGPGGATVRPALWFSPRQIKVKVATVDFDTSYPTGGEDISSLWTGFTSVVVAIAQYPGGTRLARVDKTNKKLLLFTAIGTEAADTSNQSTITGVQVVLIGY